MSDDPFDLARFVEAQADVYPRALAELIAGAKRSHWMWFIFPQMEGLGHSAIARRYALAGLDEARAYLAHPLLGPRLLACTSAINAVEGRSALAILGHPDDLKFGSSMTLFARADPENALFREALDRYCAGRLDPATLALLDRPRAPQGR
jgi:uncharacterized protein (DUF1810 family)